MILLWTLVFIVLLCLVTFVQTLYLESLRLRTRENPALEFFKETLEERLGLDTAPGMLAYSLIKHTLLVVGGGVFILSSWTPGVPLWRVTVEGLGAGCISLFLGGYALPQILYRVTDGQWLLPLVPFLRTLALLVRPVVYLLQISESLFKLGGNAEPEEPATASEEIEALIDAGKEEGIIEESDRKLIQAAVEFGDKRVREVMTPRPRIVAISADKTLEELRQLVIHEQFSRIPVFEDTIDHMVGFVHVRDMFERDREDRNRTAVRSIMRPIVGVPESKPVSELLNEMRRDGRHIVYVVDEYGNVAGLATLEDCVEEITGEIRDEHEPGHDIERSPDGSITVAGSFDLDHLADEFGFRPPGGTAATTVGGLVTEWLGLVPPPGGSIAREGLHIEVLAANEFRVEKVRIRKHEPPPEA
jgi:putative hemolysin